MSTQPFPNGVSLHIYNICLYPPSPLTFSTARFEADGLNKKINQIGKDIAPLAKAKLLDSPEALKLKKDKEDLVKLKLELTELADQKEKALHSKLRLIGNIVHESVVVSDDEKDNLVVEKWWPEGRTEAGEMDRRAQLIKDGKGVTGLFSHHEVLEKIGGYDPVTISIQL